MLKSTHIYFFGLGTPQRAYLTAIAVVLTVMHCIHDVMRYMLNLFGVVFSLLLVLCFRLLCVVPFVSVMAKSRYSNVMH